MDPDDHDQEWLFGRMGIQQGELARAKVPFVPGFMITTESSAAYLKGDRQIWRETWEQTRQAMKSLERQTGKTFAAEKDPLLISCRTYSSGTSVSLMEPIVGIGLNDQSVLGLAEYTGSRRFAFETYVRFIETLGFASFDVPGQAFEGLLDLGDVDVTLDDLTLEDWFYLVGRYKKVFKRHIGTEFPQVPYEQLRYAVEAACHSWSSKRAAILERVPGFPPIHLEGQNPICVQTLVFGNAGETSVFGVVSTRNPGRPGSIRNTHQKTLPLFGYPWGGETDGDGDPGRAEEPRGSGSGRLWRAYQ